MLKVKYNTQVGSGAKVANALQGTILERAPDHGILTCYGVEEATAAGKLEHTLKVGSDLRIDASVARRTDDLATDKSKDLIYQEKVVKNQLLTHQIQEVAAAAMDLYFEWEFVAVPMERLIPMLI